MFGEFVGVPSDEETLSEIILNLGKESSLEGDAV